MASVLIVDSDPIALELLQRAFHARDSVTCLALDASEASERIAHACRDSDGLITNIDLDGPENGWNLARIAREGNPGIAIGYMSAEGHRDWVAYGVPNSVLINTAIDETEIAAAFLRFCDSARRESDHLGRATEPALFGPEQAITDVPPPPSSDAFSAIDWAATPLGASDTWDSDLNAWVRFLLTAAEPLLMLWGPERVTLFNAPFQSTFGHLFGPMLGERFRAPQSEDWPQCAALLGDSLAGLFGSRANLRLSTQAHGATADRFFNVSSAQIQNPAGSAVSAICQFNDTTEAVRFAESLRTERDRLQALLAQVPGFIAFLNGPEHRYTFTNAAYLQLVERSELVGLRVIDAFPEIIAQGFVDILDRVYATGEPFIAKGVTVTFRRKDGSDKQTFIDLNYYATRDPTGAITGIFVAGEDTTEHHRAQQRIGVLQNELLHISRVNAMGMMVSTIAHEINQPLTTIYNYMTVARTVVERATVDPLAAESLRGAADAALRAGDIIRNLKTMTTRREVLREPVALEETLREAAALASLGQFEVRIAFDLQGTLLVQGDKILIQQVLFNLVRNALEAAEAQPINVTIAAIDTGSFVEVCVSDTGPGIDAMILPRVFESFVTTKADGTGIGLSICKAIIEAHGGVIAARNGHNGGAIFCFTLPQIG